MKSSLFKTVALLFITTLSFASTTQLKGVKTGATHSTTSVKLESQGLYNRLEEINSLAKDDNLTKEDKKGLRKEVQQIKTRLAEIGGGVYISAGALILILILLIILL